MTRRSAIIVLDGVGIGAAPDAAEYGDAGSDTLGNLSRAMGPAGLALPSLGQAGLGNIAPIRGVPPAGNPDAAWGSMIPASPGKDSTTGHWEIAGIRLTQPFPTYPHGFPPAIVERFASLTGRSVVGNVAASGTEIIDRFAGEQKSSGAWILYTSADSVFQLAAHEDWISLEELYAACRTARELLVPPNGVSRVIARPFTGSPGRYQRTPRRRDFALPPPGETLLDALAGAGVARTGVGKVDDLFAGRAISAVHTSSNAEGLALILRWLEGDESGLLFANLVDFDQLYGHRNDVAGFYGALGELDAALPALRASLREDDLIFLAADHGNDPTTLSTDHSRERVPLLAFGARVHPCALGERPTFADLGATVAEWLGIGFRGHGQSFLPRLAGN